MQKNEKNYGKVCRWLANGVHMVCTWRAYGVHKCMHKCVRRGVHRGVHWRALGRSVSQQGTHYEKTYIFEKSSWGTAAHLDGLDVQA